MWLKMKNLNIFGEGLPKERGAWTLCKFKGDMARKRGKHFWGEGVDTPMHTMIHPHIAGLIPLSDKEPT